MDWIVLPGTAWRRGELPRLRGFVQWLGLRGGQGSPEMAGFDRLFPGQDARGGPQNRCMEQLASRPGTSESSIPPSAGGGAQLPAQDAAPPAEAPVLTPEELAAQEAAQAEALARAAVEQEAAEREAQLQRLLTRMQQHADFPSLKDSIRGIQSVARSESAHLRALVAPDVPVEPGAR
jgi:hypothetical protein